MLLVFQISLEKESLHQNHLTKQVLISKQLSQGNAPVVQKMSREREAGTGKERFYPLHKGHTTQVTASKLRQGRLKSPGTLH
ncbi:hypothetical protein TNCV_4630911 [Trichonephila clavipes]|nr:hypothetical protein TNCV_4630911 [Trichonephila clavipes]